MDYNGSGLVYQPHRGNNKTIMIQVLREVWIMQGPKSSTCFISILI